MKPYLTFLMLLIMSPLAKADELAFVSVEKYQELLKTAPEIAEAYMAGLASAYSLSNAMLERDKHPRLFCPPTDQVISGKQLRNLVEPILDPGLGIKGASAATVPSIALAALASFFPCR